MESLAGQMHSEHCSSQQEHRKYYQAALVVLGPGYSAAVHSDPAQNSNHQNPPTI